MTEPAEVWRTIPGHPNYQVSNIGRTRNGRNFRVLKLRYLPNGYVQSTLGKGYTKYVHRLVLLAFVGPCPPGKECAHDDGVKTNNKLGNLAWKTKSANAIDKRRHGTALFGERNPGWAGESCKNGHVFTAKNTRVEKRKSGTVRVCRSCAREHTRRTRGTPPDRYRDVRGDWGDKLEAGLELMKSGVRGIHAARIVGVGRATLGKAWRSRGGPRRARPKKTETSIQ